MKCPKCGKNNVQMTNSGTYAAAMAAVTAAAAAVFPFNKVMARSIMKSVCENM